MEHESKVRNECLQTAAADRTNCDPALVEIVRYLARIAAAQDYARDAGLEKTDASNSAEGAP